MNYRPDRWVMLKISNDKETIYKILAGWSGGYLDGDSWKLNSGCTSVEEDGDYYVFSGYSGSTYTCHKNGYGLTGMTSQVYNQMCSFTEYTTELLDETTDWGKLLENIY